MNPDEELVRYIQEMIDMISTEDDALNRQNEAMLADEIYERLTSQGVRAEKA